LLSGGEPLLRKDIMKVVGCIKSMGIEPVISSNGTLITRKIAKELKDYGVQYIGISIDGFKEIHDKIRGVKGAFAAAMKGIKNSQEAGLKVGIRFTLMKDNKDELIPLITFASSIRIHRFCIYHLVPTSRTNVKLNLTKIERRNLMKALFAKAQTVPNVEILTVDMPCDGVFLYIYLKSRHDKRSIRVLRYLHKQGGEATGRKLICIDHQGNIYPNQFWLCESLGNIRIKSFKQIWFDHPLLKKLRQSRSNLKGRCGKCKFRQICGGFRARSLHYYKDPWSEDPDCYLFDKEVLRCSSQ
jgi:radical SAM protein with 4Fe4S-binding SPASM domain